MTRYTCGTCGRRLCFCTCDAPVPELDGFRVRARPWTLAEVHKLLEDETRQQELEGGARVDDVRERRRMRRPD